MFHYVLSRHLFQRYPSTGSGFIVNDTGLVITNAHVVGYRQALKVTTTDGREFNAKVLALDLNSDLALVQVGLVSPSSMSYQFRYFMAISIYWFRSLLTNQF